MTDSELRSKLARAAVELNIDISLCMCKVDIDAMCNIASADRFQLEPVLVVGGMN